MLNSNGHRKKEYNFIFYHQIILQSESLRPPASLVLSLIPACVKVMNLGNSGYEATP